MIMTLKPSSLFLILHVIISVTTVAVAVLPPPVYNITRILENHPDFAVFNKYLTATGVAGLINSRRTVTVLAFDDVAASAAFSGKPNSVIKDVLSAHVVLDFYGPKKLIRLVEQSRSSLITTLFQASGRATGLQGFLNVSRGDTGGVAFGSGVKGSPPVSKLVGSVMMRPYDISIVQITAAVFPPGVDPNPSPPPPPVAPAPEEDVDAEAPEADAPVEDETDAEAPVADGDAPVRSPASSPAEGPDEDVDDSVSGDNAGVVESNSAVRFGDVGFGGLVMFMGILVLFL